MGILSECRKNLFRQRITYPLPVNGFVEPFAGYLFFADTHSVHCLYIVLKKLCSALC